MPEPARYRLRLTRASPPGRAADADRRQLYSAALEQFEQLLDAARNVSSAARPLPLYYALTQAGRAIAAAHGDQFANHGHGLFVQTIESDLMRTCVTPSRQPKEFQAVSQIVGSPQLTRPVELRSLWATLPDLAGTPLPGSDLPPAAVLVPRPRTVGIQMTMSRMAEATIMFDSTQPETVRSPAEIEQLLAYYPTAAGWSYLTTGGEEGRIIHAPLATATQRSAGTGAVLQWEASGSDESHRMERLREVAPEYRFHGRYWMRPGVGPDRLMLTR